MEDWTYRCYVDGNEPNLWHRWYKDTPVAQGKHDAVFDILEQRTPAEWRRPLIGKIAGADKILEIVLKMNPQYRIFGYFSKQYEFTVVHIGSHKGTVYTPKNVIESANKRRKNILSGIEESKPCVRPK